VVRELAVAISGQAHSDDDSEEDSEDEDEDDDVSLLDSVSSGCVRPCMLLRLQELLLHAYVEYRCWVDTSVFCWQAGGFGRGGPGRRR
jgi:hypothetical protein